MPTHGVSAMKRHEQYYLRDGNVCFLVESTMFRLHRHFFERESAYFRGKLNPSAGDEDGSLDSPYIIHDVKADEFAQFVWVWYNPSYSFSKKGKEHWLAILKLASQWQFAEIRNLAIRQLEHLNLHPVEKIALYKEYSVNPDLLLPSYMMLCRKDKLPSAEEGKKLSLDTVLRLAGAREKILLTAMENGCVSPTTASTPDDVTRSIIAELFELTPHSANDPNVAMEGQPSQVTNGSASGHSVVDTEPVSTKQQKKGKTSVDVPAQNTPLQNGVASAPSGGSINKGKYKATLY